MDQHEDIRTALNQFRRLFQKKILPASEVDHSAQFLRQIKSKERWTTFEAFRVYQIIKPYRRQLKKIGFDLDQVLAPKMNAPTTPKQTDVKHIGYIGNEFVVRFPFNRSIVEAIKNIPGRKWQKDKRYWTVPVSSADRLRHFAMGYGFNVGEGAMKMIEGIDENLDKSYSAERVELELDLKLRLFDFQTVGVDYVKRNHRVIIADQMGLGKTCQAIAGIIATNSFPCLVVCPKSLRTNWKNEFEKWTNKRCVVLNKKNRDKIKQLVEMRALDVVITNYDGVNTHFIDRMVEIKIEKGKNRGKTYQKAITNGRHEIFNSSILDEAHECRNFKTRRFKTIRAVFADTDIRILLTGTPIVTGPNDLAALLSILGRLDKFGGRYKFMKTYYKMNKASLNANQDVPTNLKDLNVRLRSSCLIRREKFQVLTQLPEKFRQVIKVDLDNRKEYDHAVFNLQDWMSKSGYSQERISNSMRAELLVRINYLKQIAGRGKLSLLQELISEIVASGEKVVIATWFKDTARFIRDNFDNVLLITGDLEDQKVTDEDIEANKNLFKSSPEHNILVVSYKRGGVGHTLTAASKIIMLELGWTYKDLSQMEDRIHRIGQEETAHCYYLLGKDTIDEDIYEIIEQRRLMEKEATGGQEEIKTTTFDDLSRKLVAGFENHKN